MIEVRSPADGRLVGQVDELSTEDVGRVVGGLRANQPDWQEIGPRERARWLYRYRDWLLDNDSRLSAILQSESGKVWAEATMEVPYAVEVINYYAAHAAEFLADHVARPHGPIAMNKRQRLIYQPYPVVGVLAPWNFPIALAMMDALPALLAGAAVVLKPSEFTPLSTLAAVEGWREIGAPDVFACVTGAGGTGAAVVDAVDMVQFTGSTRTGRRVAVRAAERLIPCSLELGGKDPMIVLADADLERAARGAVWGAVFNSGQICVSVERIYVEAPVYEEFVGRVVDRVRALRQGVPDQTFTTDVGPMANENQLSLVERHVEDALAKGAKAITGGRRSPDGLFFEPTVLVDVDHDMVCMTEETFGPTLPIMKVDGADEAVRLANDSRYGLSASVWSRDRQRAEAIARRLEVGAVNVNDVFGNMLALPMPHSGWRESGLGARNGGVQGIRKYCRGKAVVSNRVDLRAEPQWYPYRPVKGAVLARLMRLIGKRRPR